MRKTANWAFRTGIACSGTEESDPGATAESKCVDFAIFTRGMYLKTTKRRGMGFPAESSRYTYVETVRIHLFRMYVSKAFYPVYATTGIPKQCPSVLIALGW